MTSRPIFNRLILDTERQSFSIKHGETTVVKAVNEPLVGTVEVYFRHVSDKRELAEMKSLTDRIGTDYIKWMREKGYENMPIDGYILVRTDYPASLVIIDGVLVVTLWYDDPSVATPTQKPSIEIPKTGGGFPAATFALSGLCWLVAAFCVVTLVRGGWKRPMLAADEGSPIAEVEPEPPAAVKTHNRKRKRRKKGRG